MILNCNSSHLQFQK